MSPITYGVEVVSSRSIKGRLALYGVLAVLGALIFNDYVVALGLITFGLPVLVCAGAFYLVCYLPLIDLPYLAWRRTGNLLVAAIMILPGLILPVGLPLAYNAHLQKPSGRPMMPVPEKPVIVRHILVVGEGSLGDIDACGEFCQALLWSGAVDHVLTRQDIRTNQRLPSATLFVVEPSAACPPIDGYATAPAPRNGLCIVGSGIPDPSFDAIVQVVSSFGGKPRLPFGIEEHYLARSRQVWVYDCRADCVPIADMTWENGERLAVPLTLHFEGGLDTGGPFGFFLARRPFALNSPAEILRTTFGLDTTGFAPKTGFHGDVTHGGPATPPSWFEYFQKLNAPKVAETIRRENEVFEYARALEEKRRVYIEKLKAVRAAHPDCPSPIISPGPEPRYMGCNPNGLPFTDSIEDVQAKLRH